MRLARSGLKSATVADLGLRATLTRVGRRKAPDLSLPAGRLIRLQAGKQISVGTDQPTALSPDGRDREHDIFLWSPDGKAALKLHYQYDPREDEACWATSAWKHPVRVDKVPLILDVEGVPLRQADVAIVRDVTGLDKIELHHSWFVDFISVTLHGDDEALWSLEARENYLKCQFKRSQ
jgi:hypothetical protein